MVENIIKVISDNRFWIMPLLVMIEIPVAVWVVWNLFKVEDSKFKIKGRKI